MLLQAYTFVPASFTVKEEYSKHSGANGEIELNSTVDIAYVQEEAYQSIVQPPVIQPLPQPLPSSDQPDEKAAEFKLMNAFDFADRETKLGNYFFENFSIESICSGQSCYFGYLALDFVL